MMLALLLAVAADAQTCSCSVGGGEAVTPVGRGPRAGGFVLSADYGAAQVGGEATWEGFSDVDREGNSMPGMAMPGHLSQTLIGTAIVGLSEEIAATASVPWIDSHPLYPSDMAGDVDADFPGDVSLGLRWSRTRQATTTGLGIGTTVPTGRVLEGGGARGGRGAEGGTARGEVLEKLGPHVDLGGAVSAVASLYPSPKDGYLVGPSVSAAFGTRLWPREQGRVRFDEYLIALSRGHDRIGSAILDQTGMSCLAVASGGNFRFWGKKQRSASINLRAQVPLVQVVGDPWLAQNWSINGGFSVVAF
jgi:hypothetical protein